MCLQVGVVVGCKVVYVHRSINRLLFTDPDSNTDAEAQAQGAQRRFSNLDMVRRPSEEFLYQFWARTFLAETLDMERIDFTFAYFPVKKEKDFLGK